MAGLKRITGRVGGIRGGGEDDGIKMLVRVGIAVTCSVVAYTVSYLTTRGGGTSSGSEEEDEDLGNPALGNTTTGPAAAPGLVLPLLPSEGTKVEEDNREKLLLHQEEEDKPQQVVEDEDSQQQSLEKKEKEAEEEQHEQQDTLTAAPDLPLAESLDRRDDEEDVLNLDSEPGQEQQLDVQEAPGTAGSWYGIRNFRSDTPTSLEANGEDQKGAKSDAAWGKNFLFSGRKAEGHVSLELEALRSTVHRLREKEKQLESQILEYKRCAEAQASTLKDLQEKETRMAEKVLEYRESSERLREREKTFLDREQEKDVEIMELRSCLEALELQGKHQALEISAGENVKKELDDANARVEELQKQVHTNAEQENANLLLMQEKVWMLETQCEEEGSKIVELRSHLEAVELQRINQVLEISASESVKKKELDEVHATVEELKKEMQAKAEQANADLALMTQKVSMLETQCEEEGSKIMELRSHLEAAEFQWMLEISASENVKKELDEAHVRVKELQKEMQTHLEQENAELTLMKHKVSMLETRCEELHKKDGEIIELRSCLDDLELQIVNHASEISASEKLKKELDEARARVEELQKEVQTNAKQANIELLMMKEKVSMLETQCEELNEKDVEIMELRSHLEVVELERRNLTSEIFANEKLKKELDEAHAKVEELQKEMETNAEKGNVELSVLIQKVSMLEIQCEELHEKNVEITKLKSHLKALKIQNMNQALEIFASEELKKELDYARARIEELQREVQTNVEQANIKLSMMKQKVSMLETQCEEEQSKITQLRSCLEGLEFQNKNQALEISTSLKLKAELEEAHARRVEELQKEMQTNVEQANVELSMTKHKVSMLETQCEEKGCKIEELGSHLASLELQNRNQALEISKVQELKKELEEAHVAMVEKLQKKMQTNVEQANVELSITKQKVSMLETQCQEKRCKIEELGSHLEGLELQSKNQTLEIFAKQKLQKELEEAHGTRIEELQKEMQTNVEQANAKLSMMKQKVSMLETQCEEKGNQIEELKSHIEVLELQNKNHTLEISTWQKLKKELEEAHIAKVEELQKEMQTNVYFLQEMEGEVVGLQHTNKELEQQKIELNERLSAMEIKLAHHFEMEKEDHEAKPKENIIALRHVNEDLIKQVEGLQSNRFSEVEELVYLRWVNACLRHELRNHQTTLARVSALDLNKSSSPESMEKAKQLMLEYIGSGLVALQAKDHIDIGHEGSFSAFSENSGDDNDIPSISGHIPRKQSFIRRLRNWTTRHLEVGTNVSTNFVSPLESEKWSHFHSDPKHRQQNIIGTKVPKETTTHIHRHASDMTLSKETTTHIHKHASDMTSIGIASPMGGKKFDADAMNSSSSYPRRTASDSIVLDGASLRSDHVSPILKKPNLPPLETTIMEDDDNPLNGSMANATFRPMARSLAFKIGENPSIKDKHNEARDREKEIKEKAKAERERIRKEKMQVEKTIELQPSTPQQLEGMSLAQVEKTTSKIMPKPPPKPLGPLEQHGLSLSSIESQGPPLWNGIPTTPSPLHSKENSTFQLQTKENNMQRAPEVVELYMSLMKNEDARENESLFLDGSGNAHDVHNNTINEIDDRSTHRLVIKADVETLGEFVQTLATEVRMAIYYNIDDVVAFVNWLDEELSLLVDETAVLKHFDWPQAKVDALREAAFEYLDLTKLQEELSLFEDTPQLHYEEMFKNMLTLLEKVELSVNGFLRTRDMEVVRYQEFHIPIDWMLDFGVVGKIKRESVKLARLYINKVLSEVDHVEENAHKEPMQEFILLQGVRFAFRVHQFAGGFDAKSMKAFEALRDRAHVRNNNSQ